MDDEAPTDLQRLKAMVAQLEASNRPMVAWISIYQLARGILIEARDSTRRSRKLH